MILLLLAFTEHGECALTGHLLRAQAHPKATAASACERCGAGCGHIGCCDTSPMQHASAHAKSSGHPVIVSFEPGVRALLEKNKNYWRDRGNVVLTV